jgi:hypothetical protein
MGTGLTNIGLFPHKCFVPALTVLCLGTQRVATALKTEETLRIVLPIFDLEEGMD